MIKISKLTSKKWQKYVKIYFWKLSIFLLSLFNLEKVLKKSKEKANRILLYSTQKLCDMMISIAFSRCYIIWFGQFCFERDSRLQLTSKVENLWDLYCMMTRGQWGLWKKKFLRLLIENLSICLAKNDMYLTMLGWSNFSSCFSREISRRMAIGTPSSVSENRIFFKATICSVVLSRAR